MTKLKESDTVKILKQAQPYSIRDDRADADDRTKVAEDKEEEDDAPSKVGRNWQSSLSLYPCMKFGVCIILFYYVCFPSQNDMLLLVKPEQPTVCMIQCCNEISAVLCVLCVCQC